MAPTQKNLAKKFFFAVYCFCVTNKTKEFFIFGFSSQLDAVPLNLKP